MLQKALSLCDAAFGTLFTYDGEFYRTAAHRNIPSALLGAISSPLPGQSVGGALGAVAKGENLVHLADIVDTEDYRSGVWSRRVLADLGGARTALWVALLGVFVLYRTEVRPFSQKQVALLQNFAAQAVVAMVLITATREALNQQTATAEVLQVINSSPGDLAPVFDAMLGKATQLCEAEISVLWTYRGDQMNASAILGAPPPYAEFLREGPRPLSPTHLRLQRGERVIQIVDVPSYEGYLQGLPLARALFDLGGVRTILMVPLRKDDAVLGAFAVYRREVQPFTDKQISLVRNFAAQAVVAMENARLLTETREALEQQTATTEVLQVINSSPGDLAPVFDAMLERAVRLCEVDIGTLWMYDGEMVHAAAIRGAPPRLAEFFRHGPHRPAMIQQQLLRGERVVQVADLRTTEAYRLRDPIPCAAADLGGVRTVLVVPLRKDDTVLGNFAIYRCEVRPFTDKQISLLQNFAAQAVIAIENARLLTETREALDQQTATAEVLGVINSSPGELTPVFDAMLERATRLCEAEYGLLGTYGPEGFRGVAALGLPMGSADALSRIGHPPAGTTLGRVERTRETVQIIDIAQEPAYAEVFKINPWLRQVHSNLVVPLLKDDELIGVLALDRLARGIQPALAAVLSDINMPGMDGLELLGEIKQRRPDLPVMMVTAYGDDERRRRARELGASEFITKPVDFGQLKSQLRQSPTIAA